MYFKDGFGKLSELETLGIRNIQWNCLAGRSELHVKITSIIANSSLYCTQIFQFLLVLWELAWNFWFYLHNPSLFIYLLCYTSAERRVYFKDTSVILKYKAHVKDWWEFGNVINADSPPPFGVLKEEGKHLKGSEVIDFDTM